jgi:hypothetical protein
VRPIRIKGYKAKAGRLVEVSTARSVSDKIREKKSKKPGQSGGAIHRAGARCTGYWSSSASA